MTSTDRGRYSALGGITLDGAPAQIIGTRNAFATVARVDGAARFDWSWSAVETIVSRDGDFKSR